MKEKLEEEGHQKEKEQKEKVAAEKELTAPAGDTTLEENDDSSESEANPKDDGVILAHLALDKPIIPMTPSANPLNSEDPPTEEAQDLPPKGDEIPKDPPAS